MTLAEVQSRTVDLAARLQALGGSGPGAGGVLRSFSDALSAASSTPATSAADPVSVASTQIGTRYVWGGEQPGVGFDCSGLVQWTFRQLGVDLPRTAAEQAQAGTAVSPADAQPGDLVFFTHHGSSDHIGIYAGNGQWVVAPHTGSTVRLEPVDLHAATSIRRVAQNAVTPTLATQTLATQTLPTQGDWAAALPAAGQPYAGAIAQAASAEGVDPALLASVAWTESGFRPEAQSGAGAQGLMQLMPATAAGLGVDPLDPAQALQGGARYLRGQLDRFGGRADLALAAYNAGPTAVRKYGGIPPFPETQSYVQQVLDRYRQLGGAA